MVKSDFLAVFNGDFLPPASDRQLISIYSHLETSPTWLLAHFIQASVNRGDSIVLASTQHPLQWHISILRRLGIDLQALIRKKMAIFVDLLSDVSNLHRSTSKVRAALDQLVLPSSNPSVFLEGFDMYIACETASATGLHKELSQLRALSSITVVTINGDDELVLNTNIPIEANQDFWQRSMAHESILICVLRPLVTGRAKDVTGTIKLIRGPAFTCSKNETITQGSYLYHIREDASSTVDVFPRG